MFLLLFFNKKLNCYKMRKGQREKKEKKKKEKI